MADSCPNDPKRPDPTASRLDDGRPHDDLSSFPELMTINQVARCLGIGRSTLYRLLAEGMVPVQHFRIGREIRLPKRQLLAWLEGQRDDPNIVRSTYGQLDGLFSSRAS